jgi:hypothetical protein
LIFFFSPPTRRQRLGRWHRDRASRADGAITANHFHRPLAANAPAAGIVIQRGADRLHHLLLLSPRRPFSCLPHLLPYPHRHPAPGGRLPHRLASAGPTAGHGIGIQRLADGTLAPTRIQRLPDGTHAVSPPPG